MYEKRMKKDKINFDVVLKIQLISKVKISATRELRFLFTAFKEGEVNHFLIVCYVYV
jgi:hypothetical protein